MILGSGSFTATSPPIEEVGRPAIVLDAAFDGELSVSARSNRILTIRLRSATPGPTDNPRFR